MSQPYVAPSLQKSSFNCPHCNAYSAFIWSSLFINESGFSQVKSLKYGACWHCKEYTVWVGSSMIHPNNSSAPPPNPDLPEEIKSDFEEARSIISRSPRGSAALLRLCVQKLCKALGGSGKNLNKDIGTLVKKGLNQKLQKSLDVVRVVGNESVHPGQFDLRDTPEIANQLFILINIIADAMITQPKVVDEAYGKLPSEKVHAIEHRDKKSGN